MNEKRIKKCCASCGYKTVENDGRRVCRLMQLVVEQLMVCPKWDMAEGLKNAGRSKGRIKRHEYLMFVFEVRMQEREAIDNGILLPEDVATLDSLRERFELETGLSPFMIH